MPVIPLMALGADAWMRVAAILGVIAALAGTYGWGAYHRAQAAQARAELVEFRAAYDILANATREQSAAIQAQADAGKKLRQAAERARRDALAAIKARKAQAEALGAARPKTCAEAAERVRETLR